MAINVDVKLLRSAAPSAQAAYFKTLCSRPNVDKLAVTNELIGLIASGSLGPMAISPWLFISHDPRVIDATLRQPHSESARHVAMKCLTRELRRGETFAQTWDGVGGSTGLAELMSKLSVKDVGRLCQALGGTGGARGAMEERQRALSELYSILKKGSTADGGSLSDGRPLDNYYDSLIPGCTAEKASEWTMEKYKSFIYDFRNSPRRLHICHRATVEQMAVDRCFRQKGHVDLSKVKPLLKNNWALGIKVLARLAEVDGREGLRGYEFINDLAIPLVKRFRSRRNDIADHATTWNLIIKCLQKHETMRNGPPWEWTRYGAEPNPGLMHHLMRPWNPSPKRPHDEAIFKTLIGLLPSTTIGDLAPEDLMRIVAPHHRYLVLRLFLQYATPHKLDIGSAMSTDIPNLKNSDSLRSTEIFLFLPPPEALNLLRRSIQARSGERFLLYKKGASMYSILQQPIERGVSFSDAEVLQILLLQQVKPEDVMVGLDTADIIHRLRTKTLPEHKKRATKAREGEDRAFWAIAACNLSIAIGDLDLYAETLLWARRFTKDFVAAPALHAESAILTREGLDLLGVLPAKGHQIRTSKEEIAEKIEKANKIVLQLVENLTLAVREPFFAFRHMQPVFQLATKVSVRRLERFHELQDHFELSDGEAYDLVLQPTLDMLIAIEVTATNLEHDELSPEHTGHFRISGHIRRHHRQPIFTFHDKYMEARNDLMVKYRSSKDPSVLTQPSSWPRGLPVQNLWDGSNYGGRSMPYVESRVMAVIFCSPDVTLVPPPEDEHLLETYRMSLDIWAGGLRIYLKGADGSADRAQRILKAWKYATTTLTGDRMCAEEASGFWKIHFLEVPDKELEMACGAEKAADGRIAGLPLGNDPTEACEWNPDPNFVELVASSKWREISPTALDYALLQHQYHPPGTSTTKVELLVRKHPEPENFWKLRSRSHIDTFIAAAMLSIDSRHGLGPSLLAKPFPNEQEPRFPAMYLDQDFLERDTEPEAAFSVLEDFSSHVPPQLLANLAESMLNRINSDANESKWAFYHVVRIFKVLSNGDRPSLAGDLVQRFVLEMPQSSSWHRALVGQGFLRGLSFLEAREFLQSFSNAVLEKLQLQEDAKQKRATDEGKLGTSVPSGAPWIKVTTLKLLAQLLSDSAYINTNSSIRILMDLARRAKHFDVRVETFSSLISKVTGPMDPTVRSQLYGMLSDYAVPAAGSVHEREPGIDWGAADVGEPLPEVGLPNGTERPILGLLMNKMDARRKGESSEVSAVFKRMVESSLRLSAENNSRWNALFMKKHGLTLANGQELPKIAALPAAALRFDEPVLDAMKQHVLLNLSPPPELVAFNKSIKDDSELSNSNAGKHWLNQWDCPGAQALALGVTWAARQLKPPNSKDWNASLDAFVFQVVDVILAKSDLDAFESLMGTIRDLNKTTVLQRIIRRIDAIRTTQWQTNPNRQPQFLPSTFDMQLVVLGHPPVKPDQEENTRYADNVVAFMEPLLSSGVPCDGDLKSLITHVSSNKREHLTLAITLGSLGPFGSLEKFRDAGYAPTRVEYRRVEMSLSLIRRADRAVLKKPEAAEPVKAMVRAWQESSIEYFRECARTARESRAKGEMRHEAHDLFA